MVELPTDVEDAVDVVASRLGLPHEEGLVAQGRYGDWALLMQVMAGACQTISGPAPLVMHTTFHGGWGVHYMFAERPLLPDDYVFAIREGGSLVGFGDSTQIEEGELLGVARQDGIDAAVQLLRRHLPYSWDWPQTLLSNGVWVAEPAAE